LRVTVIDWFGLKSTNLNGPVPIGCEWNIIKDLSTRTLAFIAGKGELLYGVTPCPGD